MPETWDRFKIKAEINRRGKTLTDLALENGLGKSTVRVALIKPVPTAHKVISEFLGETLHALWPHWYNQDGTRRPTAAQTSRSRKGSPSQNAQAA